MADGDMGRRLSRRNEGEEGTKEVWLEDKRKKKGRDETRSEDATENRRNGGRKKKTVRQRKRDGGTATEEQQEVSPACVTRPGQSHVAAAREGLHFGQFFRSSVPMIRASSFPGEQFSETQYPLMGSCHWGGGVPC